MSDDWDPDASRPKGPDETEREAIIAVLMEHDAKLQRPSEPLHLEDGLRWTPDLVDADRAVHIELGEQIPKPFGRRLRATRAAGRKVVVGTKAEAVTFETLQFLQELEVAPFELRVDEESCWHGWAPRRSSTSKGR